MVAGRAAGSSSWSRRRAPVIRSIAIKEKGQSLRECDGDSKLE